MANCLSRALSASVVDDTASQPDWNVIRGLVIQSYRELRAALDRQA